MEPSTGLDAPTLSQLHASLYSQPVSRELHAFCRLCLPSAGPRLLELSPDQLRALSTQCHAAVDAWLCCDRTYEVMRDAPSLTTRDSTLPAKTKARDGACVITSESVSFCDASHIIPYSVGKSQARLTTDLWTVLEMFWGTVPTAMIKELIFGPTPQAPDQKTLVNRLYNVITLSASAHKYWAEGLFVLEPHLGDDGDDLYSSHAVFRWIYPNESSRIRPGEYGHIALTAPTPPLSTIMAGDGGRFGLVNWNTNQMIQDGHVVRYHTDDPVARPLPSKELLWLQASLIRVLRMAGRAGWDVREMNESERDADSVCASDGGVEGRLGRGPATTPTEQETQATPSRERYHARSDSPIADTPIQQEHPPPTPRQPTIGAAPQLTEPKPRFVRHLIDRAKSLVHGVRHRKSTPKAVNGSN